MAVSNFGRRDFLKAAAGLSFVIGAGGVTDVMGMESGVLDVNKWLTIRADGSIWMIFPSTEMVQSSYSTLPQILAEDLDADWTDVEIVQLNEDDRRFGNTFFGGVLYKAGSTGV